MSLMELSASELSRLIATRALKPSEVMEAYLERLSAANPSVNAIVSPREPEELLAEAKALDDEPGGRGWLHGIPMAVKDLVSVRGIRTTFGSPLHGDHVPDTDDLVAERLRAAGAIFTGKTNTPEWGQGSHTFNPVFGVTRNPYDLSRSAGGSSGGAAAFTPLSGRPSFGAFCAEMRFISASSIRRATCSAIVGFEAASRRAERLSSIPVSRAASLASSDSDATWTAREASLRSIPSSREAADIPPSGRPPWGFWSTWAETRFSSTSSTQRAICTSRSSFVS